jgi:Ser/Thr protein kinase RdoA (MazF antagonist)
MIHFPVTSSVLSARLITILRSGNIGVSYAIADVNGKYIQTMQAPEGNRFGVLFSFAAGEKRHNPSAETHFWIGEIMAKIHVNTVHLSTYALLCSKSNNKINE